METQGYRVPSRGRSRCKGPEAQASWEGQGSSKRTSVAVTKGEESPH